MASSNVAHRVLAIGVGVGVSFGVVALALLGALLFYTRRQTQNMEQTSEGQDPPSGAGSAGEAVNRHRGPTLSPNKPSRGVPTFGL